MTIATQSRPVRTSRVRTDAQAAQPIAERLESLLRRIKFIIALRGLLGVAAAGLAVILILMGLDVIFVVESAVIRGAVSLAALGLVLLAAWRMLVRPLRRRLSLTTVARMVEEHHPELQERVSSAFELLSATDGRGSRGSEQLIAALAAEAAVDVRTFDPRREVATGTLRPYVIAAAVLAGVFLSLFVFWPRQSANLLLRMLAPGMNLDRVQALSMEVTPHDDMVVALGAPLTVSVRASEGRLIHPDLRHIDSAGHEVRHAMQPVASSAGSEAFAHHYDAVLESFQFRIQEGPMLTRVYTITAVPRPAADELRVQLEYPAHTGLASASIADTSLPFVAPEGTRLAITAMCNRPIAKGALRIGNDDLPGQHNTADDSRTCRWSVAMMPGKTAAMLSLEDEHGITSEPRPLYWQSLADRAPRVRISDPAHEQITLKPTERFDLQFIADEDFGISAAELLISIDGATATSVSIPLPTSDTPATSWSEPQGRAWRGTAPLDLRKLELGQAKQLTVHVRVRDNRPDPAGAQVAISPPLTITLDQNAPSYPEIKVKDHVDVFGDRVKEVLKELKQLQPIAQSAVDKSGQPGQPPAELDQVRNTAGDAAHQLREIARQFEGTLLTPLTPALKNVANEPLEQVQRNVDEAQDETDPGERQQDAREAQDDLDKAVKKLEAVLGDLPRHQEELGRLAMLENLVTQQKQAVEDIDHAAQQPSTTEPQPSDQQPWRNDESAVSKKANDLAGSEPQPKQSDPAGDNESPPQEGKEGDKAGEKEEKEGKEGMGEKEGDGSGKGKSPGKGNKPGTPSPSPASALAEASSQASQASAAPSAAAAQSPAASALASLMQAASAKAQGMGVPSIGMAMSPGQPGPGKPGPGMPGMPGPPGPEGARTAGPAGMATGLPNTAITSGGEWIVWRSNISGNATASSGAETPADFRDIVDRYFSALSQHGTEAAK